MCVLGGCWTGSLRPLGVVRLSTGHTQLQSIREAKPTGCYFSPLPDCHTAGRHRPALKYLVSPSIFSWYQLCCCCCWPKKNREKITGNNGCWRAIQSLSVAQLNKQLVTMRAGDIASLLLPLLLLLLSIRADDQQQALPSAMATGSDAEPDCCPHRTGHHKGSRVWNRN